MRAQSFQNRLNRSAKPPVYEPGADVWISGTDEAWATFSENSALTLPKPNGCYANGRTQTRMEKDECSTKMRSLKSGV
jgi:hypothetical protein